MWRQFVEQPWFRGRTGARLTHLHLADEDRRAVPVAERVTELQRWWSQIQDPGFDDELERVVADAVREVAVRHEARLRRLKQEIQRIQATRWWRLRTAVATVTPPRALRARRPGAP